MASASQLLIELHPSVPTMISEVPAVSSGMILQTLSFWYRTPLLYDTTTLLCVHLIKKVSQNQTDIPDLVTMSVLGDPSLISFPCELTGTHGEP